MTIRIVYSDLDGTMVGPGGCFFFADGRALTLDPARALVDLIDAGLTLVLVSGRTRPQLLEACRVFAADGFIAEMGSLVEWEQGRHSTALRGAMPAGDDRLPATVIEEAGLVTALLQRYPGRLEYHSPWHAGHEADVMLRGRVDPAEVEAWLADQGYGWLRLNDNGVLPRNRPVRLAPEAIPAHVYHLMPDGVSKGLAVAFDLHRRGIPRDEAVAIGDSASDLSMAPEVGTMFLTANGLRHPDMRTMLAAHPNVRVTDQPLGLGWVQAIRWALAGR